ncbi:MAG: DUF72 domain-containing protein [Chloroflexi bacterium]|nr:DUF72 domain-containing protein [Chloroflexota bacterium]
MGAKYYIGTSGWHYDHWRGVFYPADLGRAKWLEFYSQRFDTAELNNTFYRLPSEKAFAGWRESSPPGFVFSLKVSRFITHIKRCRDVAVPVDNFIERARLLGEKRGPLLYQLPPNMKRDDRRLEEFLEILPGGVSHVFEFRHDSWLDDAVLAILRRYNAGFCIYDLPGFTTPVTATADFAYIRFHGSQLLYGSCYSDDELNEWARKIRTLRTGVVYAYFNNDAEGFAVRNALTLRHLLET